MKTPISHIVLFVFFISSTLGPLPEIRADEFTLPVPGVMIHLSPPLVPPMLKGIKIHPDNPFNFDFILDKGDNEESNEQLKEETSKLIKYFLASLTIPDKDLWVNLSPYEKERIIPQSFGLTEMGRDLLAEDYMLKQITASLIYPNDEIGKKFWKRIYEEAKKKFGTTNITVNTFNKVWIIPEKAVVYENAKIGTAYIVESKLKVMLEEDYLSLQKHSPALHLALRNDVASVGANIVREIIIPELTKEVNEDKSFSKLRQVYNSLILATWYKKKIKDSILSQVYADKNKVAGINIDDPQEKNKIYERYLKAFKKGVYNFIKEEQDPITQQIIPRKYFSGGMELSFDANKAMIIESSLGQMPSQSGLLEVSLFVKPTDNAMTLEEIKSDYARDIENLVGVKWDDLNEDTKRLIQMVGIERTKQMAEAASPYGKNIFLYGLQGLYKVFDEDELNHYWKDLVDMVRETENYGLALLKDRLPELRRELTPDEFKEYWTGLFKMVKVAGDSAALYGSGISNLHKSFTKDEFKNRWEDLTEMALAVGYGKALYLFQDWLPEARKMFTPDEFESYWKEIVKMVKAAGPNAGYIFKFALPSVREFITPETFPRIANRLVALANEAGPIETGIFRDDLSRVRKNFSSLEEFIDYAKRFNKILSFLDQDQEYIFTYGLLTALDIKNIFDNTDNIKTRFDFVLFLFSLSRNQHEKEEVLVKFLEPYIFRYADEISVPAINALIRTFQNEESLKYSLYFIKESSRASAEVKRIANNYIAEKKLFKLHDEVANKLKTGEKNVLVIQNIKDGQGDELIRMVPFIEGLLDFNKDMQVTIVTGRPYVYDNPRVKIIPMASINDQSLGILNKTYDVVIDHYDKKEGYGTIAKTTLKKEFPNYGEDIFDRLMGKGWFEENEGNEGHLKQLDEEVRVFLETTYPRDIYERIWAKLQQAWYSQELEKAVHISGVGNRAFAYIRSNKSDDYFTFEKMTIGGQDYVSNFNWDRHQINNTYGFAYRLVSELGLPLKTGEDIRKNSILTSIPYPAAQLKWREMMRQVGNDKRIGILNKPVILFNPYGGETEEKGFIRSFKARQEMVRLISEMTAKGFKVVILPNGTEWGTKKIADELYALLPQQVRQNCVVAPEPAIDSRMFKYFVTYSDYVLTVEGGMMHLAYNLGKPFGVILKRGGGRGNWLPYGRSLTQRYTEDINEVQRTINQKRIQKIGKVSRSVSKLFRQGGRDKAMLNIAEPQLKKDNAHGRFLRSLVVEHSSKESQQRLELLHELGPKIEKIVQGVLENDKIKIALIPLGSTLKGYAGQKSDVEYTICILSGSEGVSSVLEPKQHEKILKAVNDLIVGRGFEPEEKLNIPIFDYSDLDNIFFGSFLILFAEEISYMFLPVVYGESDLIDQVRRNILVEISHNKDKLKLWEAVKEHLNEEYATVIKKMDIFEKSHLRGFLLDNGIDPRSQGALRSFNSKRQMPDLKEMLGAYDLAQASFKRGGIDFTAKNMNLQTQNAGEGIKFHLDPAMLAQLRNAPGFVPVIINIQPLKSLQEFLGLNQDSVNTS